MTLFDRNIFNLLKKKDFENLNLKKIVFISRFKIPLTAQDTFSFKLINASIEVHFKYTKSPSLKVSP